MITYDTRAWIKPVLKFHKADTFRKLAPALAGLGIFTLIVYLVEHYVLDLPPDSVAKNIPIMHSLLGFAISMLLVFRTNSAYDRWWEGRKLWGSLVNNSRNLAVKLDGMLAEDDHENRLFFRRMLRLFPYELHLHLRKDSTGVNLDESYTDLQQLFDQQGHMPAQISRAMHHRVYALAGKGLLSDTQLWLLNNELQSLLDICGACERIKNTPIPYSYSSFIKKFIAVYVITLPFGFVFTVGLNAILIVMFIFYVLASLELIAEEIEDPFGADINDLPTDKISGNISKSVYSILRYHGKEVDQL